MKNSGKNMVPVELIITIFVIIILFAMPLIFTRVNGDISWRHVTKIWMDQLLIIPLFILNHWLLVPRILFRKRYALYLASIVLVIASFTIAYRYIELHNFKKPKQENRNPNQPDKIPPYANLLMYSILIVGVDAGLLFLKKWHEIEENRHILERQNSELKLEILRNQVSPHFFMNTLNNIYALIDHDSAKAKNSVMKLSKLMRYMLYESENGHVRLSKEFEFIQSYIDLMKLRFTDELRVNFTLPHHYNDILIPPLIFVSFIENAFKYGASYQENSEINILFTTNEKELILTCDNTKHNRTYELDKGGIGLRNSLNRLNLLYGNSYHIDIQNNDESFHIELKIPIS